MPSYNLEATAHLVSIPSAENPAANAALKESSPFVAQISPNFGTPTSEGLRRRWQLYEFLPKNVTSVSIGMKNTADGSIRQLARVRGEQPYLFRGLIIVERFTCS